MLLYFVCMPTVGIGVFVCVSDIIWQESLTIVPSDSANNMQKAKKTNTC